MPKGCGGLGFEEYSETLFDERFLPFRYWCIGLLELNAEEYLATKNPIAYGLAPLMNHGPFSKPRLKAICLSSIAQSNINEVQSALLAYFVDTYLPLNEAEEEEFQQLIQREEVTTMQFITSWERQGIIKGRAEGELIARRETLLLQLQEKFGEVPSTITQQVEAISSKGELEQLYHLDFQMSIFRNHLLMRTQRFFASYEVKFHLKIVISNYKRYYFVNLSMLPLSQKWDWMG